MKRTPYVASLRVYEPLSTFTAQDQNRWRQLPATAVAEWDEQTRALHRVITAQALPVKPDGAYILDQNGKSYVAPWSTTTRCWAALDDFKSSMPPAISKFFLAQSLEESIRSNATLIEEKIPHIISATWSIPPRWFALFEPADRLRGKNDEGVFTTLRTPIFKAKQRCSHAHQVIVTAFGNGPIEQEIADLLSWLSVFHTDSIVECDYGGLAKYMEKLLIDGRQPGLTADTSIEDVARSLAGLAAGDGALAGQGYERLVTRWRGVAAFEQAM
jgi:hypothetical protein